MIRQGVLWIILLVSACADPHSENVLQYPLIPKEDMAVLIYKLQWIESAYSVRSYDDSLATPLMLHRVNEVFSELGVTQAQFEESLRYYQEFGAPLEEIYSRALELTNESMAKAEAETADK